MVKGLAVLVTIVLLLVVALVASLDAPMVRGRIRALVKLPIDWQHARLSLTTGLRLEGFSIANEAPFDKIAPHFLEIDHVDVSWALLQLLGTGPLTERVVISGVRAIVIIDADGKNSLSTLSPPRVAGAPIPPSTPLSQTLEVLGDRLPIERAVVRDATVRVVQLYADGPQRELDAAFEADIALPKANELEVTLAVRLVQQHLIEELPPVKDLFNLTAHASFHPAEKRVLVAVPTLHAFDGAMKASADVQLFDEGAPLVDKANLTVDTAPVQATLDHQKSPLHLRGTVSIQVTKVRAASLPVIEPGGSVDARAELEALVLHLEKLRVDGDKLDLGLKLRPGKAEAAVKARHFALVKPGFALASEDLDSSVGVDGLDLRATSPLRLVKSIHTEGKAARLEVRPGSLVVIGAPIAVVSDVALPGAEAGHFDLSIPIGALTVTLGSRSIFERVPAKLHVGMTEMQLDLADPLASEGVEQSEIGVGPIAIRSKLEKRRGDSVKYDLDVSATTLGPFGPFIALPAGSSVPWANIGAHAHSQGHIDGLRDLGRIHIEHDTTLELVRPEVRGTFAARATKTSLAFSSKGNTVRHTAELQLVTEDMTVAGEAVGSSKLTGHIDLDRGKPGLDLKLALIGQEVPLLELDTRFGYAGPSGGISWAFSGKASRLALVSRFLPRELTARHHLDWTTLSAELDGTGVVRRAIEGFSGMKPRLAKDPLEAARGEANVTAAIHGVDYEDTLSGRVAKLGRLTAELELKGDEGRQDDRRPQRRLELTLGLDKARIDNDGHSIVVSDWKPVLTLDARGPIRAPVVLADLDMTLGKLVQDYYPPYPVGGLKLGTTLRADSAGMLRLERFDLFNADGGSRAAIKGGIDLATPLRQSKANDDLLADPRVGSADTPERLLGRVGLDVELELSQELSRVRVAADMTASGTLKLPMRVQSADLRLFLVRGVLGLSDVGLRIRDELEVKKVQGQVPLAVEVLLDRTRQEDGSVALHPRLVSHPEGVSFPKPRFAEHQPFIAQRSYFAAESLRFRKLVLGPIAGNLAIDHTRFQLSQLEMQTSGGRVRGQFIADVAGMDTKLVFRGDVTGVMPPSAKKKSEHLDANIAIVVQPMRMLVDGRAELLHISKPLLLDLLDAWDPYHANVTANRARLALKFGYPERVRLGFEQGFASLLLELGGMTRAVRIDEIKGVPIGPLLERYVSSALRPFTMADDQSQRAREPGPDNNNDNEDSAP